MRSKRSKNKRKSRKNPSKKTLALAVPIVLGLGVLAYLLFGRKKEEQVATEQINTSLPPSVATPEIMAKFKSSGFTAGKDSESSNPLKIKGLRERFAKMRKTKTKAKAKA